MERDGMEKDGKTAPKNGDGGGKEVPEGARCEKTAACAGEEEDAEGSTLTDSPRESPASARDSPSDLPSDAGGVAARRRAS